MRGGEIRFVAKSIAQATAIASINRCSVLPILGLWIPIDRTAFYNIDIARVEPGMTQVSPSPAAIGYFVDQKKGEIAELKLLLKNINVERDVKRKREIIKKVIAYMTLGIDVSRLFTEMIMAIETKDIVVKKMVYLYLCNYAHKEPEMALMCINSLRRECDNEDPMVRGLALRSLCNLRLESFLEYVQVPLSKSLKDLSAYVRKTAVMGILKLHYISPTMVQNNGYLEQLYAMLQDVDVNVVTNVIMALNELRIAEGGMQVSQTTIMHLLNRIGEFSEWGLNVILDLVARYKPISEEETFAIMNLLDPVLRTANSGAVLATFKCFVRLTAAFPDLHPQVYARAKPPMLTLITGAQSEIQYAVLKHLEIILPRQAARGIFDDEYRQFFVRYNEPPHVKHLKVDLLPLISNDVNARDIAAELGEYVTDVDSELSKRAIRSIGQLAMRITSVAVEMAQTLIDLIDLDMAYVRAEAVIILASVMRVAVSVSPLVFPSLSKCLRKIDDPEARGALVWIIGQHGQDILEAPYLLESIIDSYGEEQSSSLKLHMLTAAMKLFFKRPPEMQQMLARLLASAVNDSSNQDVHDRALLYYRLLSVDMTVAAALFKDGGGGLEFVAGASAFAEHCDEEKKRLVFNEFNTLAVIYGMPSNKFTDKSFQMNFENAPIVDDMFEAPIRSLGGPLLSSSEKCHEGASAVTAIVVNDSVNLLDWGDSPTNILGPSSSLPSSTLTPGMVLCAESEMTPQRFQQMWGTLTEAFNGQLCRFSCCPQTTADVEVFMRQAKVRGQIHHYTHVVMHTEQQTILLISPLKYPKCHSPLDIHNSLRSTSW